MSNADDTRRIDSLLTDAEGVALNTEGYVDGDTSNATPVAFVFDDINYPSDTLYAVGHGFAVGRDVTVSGASLPPPLVEDVVYWVVAVPDPDTFKLATSAGGSPINHVSGPGSGDIQGVQQPFGVDSTVLADEGVNRLLVQLKDAPRMQALLRALLVQTALADAQAMNLFLNRTIDTALNEELDGLGALVGEPRLGRDDASYRAFVRARVLANASDGKLEQLYAIVVAVLRDEIGTTGAVEIEENYPAAIIVTVTAPLGAIDARQLFALLKFAKAAGVRIEMVFNAGTVPSTGLFRFVDEPGAAGTRGWGSTASNVTAGELSSVVS